MLLDNLFPMLGGLGTAAAMLGVLSVVGVPVVGQLFCPLSQLRRIQPRGR